MVKTKKYFTLEETAEKTGKSVQTIYYYVRNKLLIGKKVGGKMMITQESLTDFLMNGESPQPVIARIVDEIRYLSAFAFVISRPKYQEIFCRVYNVPYGEIAGYCENGNDLVIIGTVLEEYKKETADYDCILGYDVISNLYIVYRIVR